VTFAILVWVTFFQLLIHNPVASLHRLESHPRDVDGSVLGRYREREDPADRQVLHCRLAGRGVAATSLRTWLETPWLGNLSLSRLDRFLILRMARAPKRAGRGEIVERSSSGT